MRQLDLFGSLFDAPTPENKEAKQDVIAKGTTSKVDADSDSDEHPYSVVSVAKEMLAAADLKDADKDRDGLKERKVKKTQTDALSLFNNSPTSDNAITDHKIDNVTDNGDSEQQSYPPEWDTPFTQVSVLDVPPHEPSETVESEPAFDKNENETSDKTLAGCGVETEVNLSSEQVPSDVASVDASLSDEEGKIEEASDLLLPETDVVSNEQVIVEDIFTDNNTDETTVDKTSSKKTPGKLQKPKSDEKGQVIFTDGNIKVKLKNKPGKGPLLTTETKEKPQRILQKRGRKSFKEIEAEVDLIEVPEDEILFKKQYYSISEVAKWFRVNTSLLRFWENEFDVLKPRKNRKGDRLFRPEDVKNLQLIYQLLRQRKYTIEGAKEYIKTNKKKADLQLHLTHTLQKFKSFLLDLKANL